MVPPLRERFVWAAKPSSNKIGIWKRWMRKLCELFPTNMPGALVLVQPIRAKSQNQISPSWPCVSAAPACPEKPCEWANSSFSIPCKPSKPSTASAETAATMEIYLIPNCQTAAEAEQMMIAKLLS